MTSPSMLILIVEDDSDIRKLVADLLRRELFAVEEADSGAAMDDVLARIRPDLIILDVMLPGEDGIAICRRVRARDPIPIIMLTAKSEEIDRVVGLEMGADDYVVKPFGSRELVARVRALLRRGRQLPLTLPSRRFAFGEFIIDIDARQLTGPHGRDIPLTTAEFDLLAALVQQPRRVLTRDQILDRTSGRIADPFDRSVDVLVSRVRKKLAQVDPHVTLITTVRNGGYLFTVPVRSVP